jgi:hypothetical protein
MLMQQLLHNTASQAVLIVVYTGLQLSHGTECCCCSISHLLLLLLLLL